MVTVTEFLEELTSDNTAEKSNKRCIRRKANRMKFNSRLRFLKTMGVIVSAFTSRELGHLKDHGWVKRVSRPKEFKWSIDNYNKRQPESLQVALHSESKMMDARGLSIEESVDNPGCLSLEDEDSVTIGDAILSSMFEK